MQQRLDAEVRQNDELPPPKQPIGQTGSALRDRRVLISYNTQTVLKHPAEISRETRLAQNL